MFDFSIVTQWIHSMLTSFMPEGLAVFIECAAIGVCIMLAYAVIAIIMIFMERKVCAAFQCRLGPMRVGPWGTIQVFADVFKMLIKEIITIRHADNFLYNLAPYIVILASILSFSWFAFQQRDGSARLQCRHLFPDGSLQHRCGRYPACRMEFQQQVLTNRCHAKRCTDDQL